MSTNKNKAKEDPKEGDIIRLRPGYKLRVADFMSPVKIAENFTLGDLCHTIDRFKDIDIETFGVMLGCPLKPFLDEVSRPRGVKKEEKSSLHYIRLHWECEYDDDLEENPSSSLRISVDGVGDTWKEHLPGGRFYKKGEDMSRSNLYGIDLTPLYALRNLPLRIDPVMDICPIFPKKVDAMLQIPAPEVTVLQLIQAVFWELSFFGLPKQRDAMVLELQRRIKDIKNLSPLTKI